MIQLQSRNSATACTHIPACPTAGDQDRNAAHIVSDQPEQGWSLLCNGVVVFDDLGELLPDGRCIDARCVDLTAALHRPAVA